MSALPETPNTSLPGHPTPLSAASHGVLRNSGVPTVVARIFLIEEEDRMRHDLGKTLEGLGYAVAGEANNGEEALLAIAGSRPDVVLMGITQNGPMRGIEAATVIQTRFGVPVIFLTAGTDEDVLSRARIAQPYGCIVKPFKTVDVNAAIQLALYKYSQNTDVIKERDQLHRCASNIPEPPFFLRHNGRHIRLHTKDIHYVEALRDHVALYVKDERYLAHCTLKSIEVRLPARDFIRVHRSFIVRLDRIAAIDGGDITLENETRLIPIGETYTTEVISRLTLR